MRIAIVPLPVPLPLVIAIHGTFVTACHEQWAGAVTWRVTLPPVFGARFRGAS